jgi:hypothetical protein
MNLYHCFIDLKDGAKALAFAKAVEAWMEHLKAAGTIRSWRLLRRKMGLASAGRDFMLEIEVDGLAQLDEVFRLASRRSEEVERLHGQIHPMIAAADYGVFRPFPDPERAERVALL